MEDFKKTIYEYRGAIIGAIIAIILLCTQLYRLIIGIIVMAGGIFLGNYVQKNKYSVKNKLKEFIDKM